MKIHTNTGNSFVKEKRNSLNSMKRIFGSNTYKFIGCLLVVKVFLAGITSSEYMNELFLPFINTFLAGNNPYQYYYEYNLVSSFPYPPLMLLIQSIPCALLNLLGVDSLFLVNLLFKLPSLVMDMVCFLYLKKMFEDKVRYVAVVYYACPIIIYAVIMHGQLDLLPIGFLFISLYYISKAEYSLKNIVISGILIGCSISCKTMGLAVIPIILIYLWKRTDIIITLKYLCITIGTVIVINFSFISQGLLYTVYLNQEQNTLFETTIEIGNLTIYFAILAILLIYFYTLNIGNINKSLLFSLSGVILAALIIFAEAMPAWYVWIIPFATFYIIDVKVQRHRNVKWFMALNLAYLIYFIFLHDAGKVDLYIMNEPMSWKVNDAFLNSLFLTILVSIMVYFTFTMIKYGIKENMNYKKSNLPFSIGISGDSGSGKSELLKSISELFGDDNMVLIEGDGDHKWERGNVAWKEYTHLDPKANHVYRQARDIEELHNGNTIYRSDYDHDLGKFTEPHKVQAKSYMILSGLHALYLPQMREHMDLKIYMDTEESLRRLWKIKRDTAHRGYTIDKIVNQIEERIPDAIRFIYPQKQYADVVIRYFSPLTEQYDLEELVETQIVPNVCIITGSHIDFEPIIEKMLSYDIRIEQEYTEDLRQQKITFMGEEVQKNVLAFEEIAQMVIPKIEEIKHLPMKSDNRIESMIKLFLLIVISEKIKEK